jgi:hypothetical protein
MEKQAIMKLTENFFKNLNCEVNWDENILIINKVPSDFVKLYEKNPPYLFAFDDVANKNNPESELISRGSLLLKLMTTYLENKAQTTILKLDMKPDLKQIIKENLDLNNFEILNMLTDEKNDFIFRFIFMTTLQYLNEKEQMMTQIYLNGDKILEDFDISKYLATTGKIEEKNKEKELLISTKSNYEFAKENLKRLLEKKTKEISDKLSKSLEKALDRINSHYSHMIQELEKENKKNIDNLELSNQKLPRASDKNRKIIEERIARLEETIKNSTIKEDIDKLEKEKQFFISDEKHKHSINLNNSLMNTTIINYPIYSFKLFLKNKNQLKELKFSYNPVNNELSKLYCDSCKKEITEIIICDSGHLSCKDCISVCPRCQRKTCKSCQQLKCNICSGKICQKCATQCIICKKYICNSDIKKDNLTNHNICSSCAEFCNSCNKFSAKNSFRQCENCRKKFCSNCIKPKYVNGKTMRLCPNCTINIKPVRINF